MTEEDKCPYRRRSLDEPLPLPDQTEYEDFEINAATSDAMREADNEMRATAVERLEREAPNWIASRRHLTPPKEYW